MWAKTVISAAMAALTLIIAPALPGNGQGKGAKHSVQGAIANCPPGLAKKNPPCVPPGQARKIYPDYRPRFSIGDRIDSDYRVIRDVNRYGLRQGNLYYLVGREVFRISPDTGRVIAFIGLADALLN